MSRAALAILSTENLLNNLAVIKSHAPHSGIIAMVKANAYGHGLRSTALRLEKHVQSFGVASIDEALALRKVGIKIPITLMEGVFEQQELLIAACENFPVVFHDPVQFSWLKNTTLPQPLTAWLKIDTGMGRLGFSPPEAQAAYEMLSQHPFIQKPLGIMSHFACADQANHLLNNLQKKRFQDSVASLQGPKSLCNSAAIFSFKDHQYDIVRPGLALYGVSPFKDRSAEKLGLKPVMTLQSKLMAIKTLEAGNTLGYNARFICPKKMRIGVIAMGYGDGYPRTARDGTPVLVNGKRCPLVGQISMDMMTVDLENCPEAQVHDPVILWGTGLPLEEVAGYTAHTPYDILTAVQARVKFYWTISA